MNWNNGLFILGVAGAVALGLTLAQMQLAPMDCPEARKVVTAWQACLSNRPQCVIEGPEAYTEYHEALAILKEEMDSGGDCK